MLSDLKQRHAEKLERLLSQNEERLARLEQDNQVLDIELEKELGLE